MPKAQRRQPIAPITCSSDAPAARKVDDECLQELRWLYDRRDLAEARADLAAWIGKWQAKYPRLVAWVGNCQNSETENTR